MLGSILLFARGIHGGIKTAWGGRVSTVPNYLSPLPHFRQSPQLDKVYLLANYTIPRFRHIGHIGQFLLIVVYISPSLPISFSFLLTYLLLKESAQNALKSLYALQQVALTLIRRCPKHALFGQLVRINFKWRYIYR